jgi:hypothetical protein
MDWNRRTILKAGAAAAATAAVPRVFAQQAGQRGTGSSTREARCGSITRRPVPAFRCC